MTIAYAMNDMRPSADGSTPAGSVSVGGGCGVCHTVSVDAAGRAHISCPTCAPILVSRHYGWSADPASVPMTPDERARLESAQRGAGAAQNDLMSAVAADFASRTRRARSQASPAPVPSLEQVLAQASPEQLLAALPVEMRTALTASPAGRKRRPVRAG